MFRMVASLKLYNASSLCTKRFISSNVLEHLIDRTVIKITGTDVTDYLQGLITNDIKHLESGAGAMYSMFLNTKGRVMYDALIYRTQDPLTYFIECDREASQSLQKHLKMFRVRKKVDVINLADEIKVYTLFDPNVISNLAGQSRKGTKNKDGLIVPCNSLQGTQVESKISTKIHGDLIIYRDPRISSLGSRILAPTNCNVYSQISEIMKVHDCTNENKGYRRFRYILGIGEGITDLPPGDCFPLEANCDYLHGVSFHKGCYIGQELTARTHHTGVVRKRLMPLQFSRVPSKFPDDNKIVVNGKNLGKFRGIEQDVGIGLLRIAEALECENITIGDGSAKTMKPDWWPLEAPKEKMSAQKS